MTTVIAAIADIISEEVLESNRISLADHTGTKMVSIYPKVNGSVSDADIERETTATDTAIPNDQPLTAIVPRAFALCSLKKVLPFSSDNQGSHLIRLSFTKDRMKMIAEDFDFAKGSHDSFYIDYPHSEIEIGVSGSRLAAILSKLSGGEMQMGMTDPSRAITFEPNEQDEDCEVLMLTMPMLLNE